jgi:hypothetical protein
MIMKRMILLAILVGAVLPTQAGEPLADLIAKVSSVASAGRGMDEAEQKLAEELATHGTAAADLLIPLLKSESEDVRKLALHCLGQLPVDSVLDAHLPALMEAYEEHGLSPDEIAAIESCAAVHLLAKEFRKVLPFEHRVGDTLLRMGPRSVVPLLKEFEDAGEDEESFLNELADLWKEMGDKAEGAVPLLLAIAVEEEAPLHRRLHAIRYLGAIGPAAEASFPKLKELGSGQPDRFAKVVRDAIGDSRTEEAAELVL